MNSVGRGLILFAAVIFSAGAPAARAADFTFTGVLGLLSAEVNFSAVGSDLVVTLTNISLNDVTSPNEILTAVYFDIAGPTLGLSRTSAVIGPGSTVLFGGTDPGGVVGGEWAYYENATNTPFLQGYAISSAGLGVSGDGGLFPGNNLEGPIEPDGLQYGLTSAGDDPGTGNTPVSGAQPLIKNQVVFTLSGLPPNFDPSASVSNVQVQYGTANCNTPGTVDQCIPEIPEPSTALLFAAAAVMMLRRRR